MLSSRMNEGPIPPLSYENLMIKNRWRIMKLLGKGAFGQVFTAMDDTTRKYVAMKIELPNAKKPVLKLEISVLKKVQDSGYFPRFISCGRFIPPDSSEEPNKHEMIHSYIVMELLGPSLAELRKKSPDGKLNYSLTNHLSKQMGDALEYLHSKGILHRDIKPANFCLGAGMDGTDHKNSKCYLIDFGLSRRFITASGEIRAEREEVGFRGTARYASISAHFGKDLGRVDDLWSLLYVLLELYTGSLPWKGKSKELIGNLKLELTCPDLFKDVPDPLLLYHNHIQTLGFSDTPNYKLLSNLLESLIDLENIHDTQSSTENDYSVMSIDKTGSFPENKDNSISLKNACILEHRESTTLFDVELMDYEKIDTHFIPKPPNTPIINSAPVVRSRRYNLRKNYS